MSSAIVHTQFDLLYGAMLGLVRRCDAHTCMGHCMCAPQGKLCSINNTSCNDVTTGNHTVGAVPSYVFYLQCIIQQDLC